VFYFNHADSNLTIYGDLNQIKELNTFTKVKISMKRGEFYIKIDGVKYLIDSGFSDGFLKSSNPKSIHKNLPIDTILYLSGAFLGISEFILKNESLFYYAKMIGAVYIFYIGVSIIWHSKKDKGYTSEDGLMKSFNFKKNLIRGFLTNLANPLTIVGMTSFILPFFKPEMSIEAKLIFAIFIPFSTFYCFGGITLIFGNPVIRKFILPRIVWFERVAGSVIAYMAIMILFFDF
jgi:threonine/homoserine/homoserine lactone efflux protein